MTVAFLAILAAAWFAVFLPAAVRARQATPFTTTERFRRRMDLISPRSSTGRWVLVPQCYEELARASFRRGQRRRRRILLLMAVSALASLGGAVASGGGGVWEMHLAVDASLGLYVLLLVEAKKRRQERRSKVRHLRRRLAEGSVAFFEAAAGGSGN